jgi:hypothetical protein
LQQFALALGLFVAAHANAATAPDEITVLAFAEAPFTGIAIPERHPYTLENFPTNATRNIFATRDPGIIGVHRVPYKINPTWHFLFPSI